MRETQATDILKPRWNAAYKARAQKWLALGGVAAVVFAVAGRYLAGAVFDDHPAAIVVLCILPAIKGISWLLIAPAISFAPTIGRLARRFAAAILVGAVVATILAVWGVAMALAEVDRIATANRAQEAAGAVPAVGTAFGGELTTEEIRQGLPAAIRCPVLAWFLWPLQFWIVRDLIGLAGVMGFVCTFAAYAIWWERKVAGRIQSRLGPMRVGGWHGWAQSPADGLKLVAKEDLIPDGADEPLFRLAPYLTFVPALCAFLTIPFGAYWVFRHTDVGLIVVLAMLGVEVIGVILGGWSSNNKWSLYGAMREGCQMVSYEIPMGMFLLLPIMTAGTLNLAAVGEQQAGGWHTWLAFRNPFLFTAAVGYFIASLASCKRAPFDLPEAESELVAGFMTEYSGFRWCLFFFAEYAAMFVVSALATVLFFGAWHSPLPAAWGEDLARGGLAARALHGVLFSGPLWFVFKGVFLVFVQMWVRWTLPRIRIDQVMYACIQVLLPLAMVALLGHAFWMLLVPTGGIPDRIVNGVLSLIGGAAAAAWVLIMIYGRLNRRRLVGTMAIDHLPGA